MYAFLRCDVSEQVFDQDRIVVLPHPQEAFGFPGRKRLCEGFALLVGDQSEGAAVRQGVQSDGQSLFGTV